jgi:hypothetical protein
VARRSRQREPELLRKNLSAVLENFETEKTGSDLRPKVLALVPVFHSLRDLGSSLIPQDIPAAKERIRFYFETYPRKIINGDELMVVSGISDWPRRIRELRVESGWSIVSGVTAKEMAQAEEEGDIDVDGTNLSKIKPDEYILLDATPDRNAANRWKLANAIRKKKGASIQDKILEFLRANVGRPVTGEELRYVANDKSEWARRVRELRTEEGWPVATRTSGWPELAIGVYVLEEDRQAYKHDRTIPDSVRYAVLERDHFRCEAPVGIAP